MSKFLKIVGFDEVFSVLQSLPTQVPEHPLFSHSWVAKFNPFELIFFNDINSEIDETFYHPKNIKNDRVYLTMAEVWSKNSHCQRMKVGALIVKNRSIISDGYNGSPSGFPNPCEGPDNVTLPYVLHAEANAITKLAKSTQSCEDSTLFVTVSPCYDCSKLIIQSGVKRLVFRELYRKTESLSFLYQGGLEIIRLKNPTLPND
jgi:dCMP deaminase